MFKKEQIAENIPKFLKVIFENEFEKVNGVGGASSFRLGCARGCRSFPSPSPCCTEGKSANSSGRPDKKDQTIRQ